MQNAIKVLHVTEAFGAGVLTLIDSTSRRQIEAGAQVTVWFLPKSETPDDDSLRARFHKRVNLVRLRRSSGIRTYLAFARIVRSASISGQYDVIHLHSSKAGALGRLAVVGRRRNTRIFYSPHGFAFLRLDTSWLTRCLTRAVERMLVNVGDGPILTSQSEFDLARVTLHPRRSFLLRTGIPPEDFRDTESLRIQHVTGEPIVVGMIGRIAFQKAPWRFSNVAMALSDLARFVWIGDGPEALRDEWLGTSGVEVTGWLSPLALEKAMDQIDILLFPSLWEGMSMSLMQAQARGIPSVVSDAIGNIDSVLDGSTGFVCVTDEELVEKTRLLIEDKELRNGMALAAIRWSRIELTDENLGIDSLKIYASTDNPSGPEPFFV